MKKWWINGILALQCCTLSAWDNNCCDDFCSDVYVEGSWLYWQVDSSNYDFANVRTQLQDDNSNFTSSDDLLTQKMPWDSGFRVGFGFNMPCWGMDVKATWTDFRSTATKNARVETPTAADTIITTQWPFTGTVTTLDNTLTGGTSLRQKISFAFDPVNLEFGKWICFDCIKLAFRPHVGLQYLQYHDHRSYQSTSEYTDGETSSVIAESDKFKQKFQGFGVRGGFDVVMPLFCDISLVGNVAASIDWGRNKFNYSSEISTSENAAAPDISSVHGKKHNRNSQALIDLGFGIRWETCLCDCYTLELDALWEQHQLINGSHLWAFAFPASTNAGLTLGRYGDLTVRGVSVTAAIGF